MTGSYIQKVLWWKFYTRQCALPMGTHPDNPSPFVQGSIPIDLNDIGVVQWAEIVWFLPASLMQDKEDCKSIPLMFHPPPPPPQFRLWYNGLKKKRKGSRTSQRWHFNSCWADKNNMPPNINSAMWTHPEIMLCVSGVCVCVKTETGKNDSKWWCHVCSVCKRVSKNTRSENETRDEKHIRIKHLLKWGREKNYTLNLFSSSSLSFVYF